MTFLVVTELCGEFEERRRVTYLNPAAIATFAEDFLWRNPGEPKPRITRMRLITGDTLNLVDQPEEIAHYLSGSYGSDPDLTVTQAADLMARYPA